MTSRFSVPGKGTIKLVKKNDTWVPQRQRRKTTLEVHGYTICSNLGEGAFAKVKLAKSSKHNCNVAIKVIDKRKAPKDYIYKFLPREIQIMHRLNHPNVIKLYEAIETDIKVYLILELAKGGDLLEFINNKNAVGEDEARALFCQFLATVAYCHKESVVHRDLKCENILLDDKGRIKITDFGFATNTYSSPFLKTFCGSYAYCSPEILRGERYKGPASDVWSMGVVLYALVCSRLPFSDDDLRFIIKNEPRKLKFPKKTSQACRDLIKRMLIMDENKRPTAEQLLQDPWCKEELRENPDLAYLGHRESTPSHMNPPPPPPPPINEYEEEIFPQNVTPTRGSNKMVTCLTSPIVSLPVTLTFDKGRRRHTLAGNEYDNPKRRVSLRDELLRTIAAKEMRSKSSLMLADVQRKSLSLENVKKMNESKHVRRSSLVHDIKNIDHEATRERRMSMTNRKPSLVSDVTYKTPVDKPQPRRLQFLVSGRSKKEVVMTAEDIGGRSEREKELRALKFSKAGNAARMAAKEAHNEHDKQKLATTELQSHHVEEEKTTRLEKWRMKCMRLLNKKAMMGADFTFKLV